MTNKFTKQCSVLVIIIKEMQIKSTMTYHCKATRMAIVKKQKTVFKQEYGEIVMCILSMRMDSNVKIIQKKKNGTIM